MFDLRLGGRSAAAVAFLLLACGGASGYAPPQRVGTVVFANSGASQAQEDFLFAVAQLHNFEYASAAEAFRRAQQADPGFALAYWGEAMTYNHPVWQEQDRDAAIAALQRLGATPEERSARAPTERERDILATLDILYGEGDKESRDDEYALAMEALHTEYPDDPEIAAFTALAILGTAHEGRDFAIYMRAAAIAEEVFAANPQHPGAAHYLIHSYDDPIHAPLGLRAARAYSKIAPDAGHAQHMCSHIFVAAGMWDDVIAANLNAVAAVQRAMARAGRVPSPCGHYNTWLNYGYLQVGKYDEAAALTAACHDAAMARPDAPPVFDPDNSRPASFITMWARYLIDTEDFEGATATLSLDLRQDQVQERMTVAFVHGLGAARRGDIDGVREALAIIRETGAGTVQLAASADLTFELQAMDRSAVLEAQTQALLAWADGDIDAAVAHARQAATLEEQMPFMFGPPFVDKPSYELLGEILLAAGRNDEAVDAFRAALARAPGRALALAGLAAAEQ
ncbi:MAG: hypothetical protein PVJ49_12695 [Acidobacteriota bacterium]